MHIRKHFNIWLEMEKYLPWKRKVIGGLSISLKPYVPERFNEVLELMQKSTRDSKGVGEGEFHDAKSLENYLAKSRVAVTFHDEGKNDRLIAVLLLYGTPMSRSSRPLHGAGYSAVDKTYRGMGVFNAVFEVLEYGIRALGFAGGVPRNALTSVAAIVNVKSGSTMTAVLPKAINIPKLGMLSDLVAFEYNRVTNEKEMQEVS